MTKIRLTSNWEIERYQTIATTMDITWLSYEEVVRFLKQDYIHSEIRSWYLYKWKWRPWSFLSVMELKHRNRTTEPLTIKDLEIWIN